MHVEKGGSLEGNVLIKGFFININDVTFSHSFTFACNLCKMKFPLFEEARRRLAQILTPHFFKLFMRKLMKSFKIEAWVRDILVFF